MCVNELVDHSLLKPKFYCGVPGCVLPVGGSWPAAGIKYWARLWTWSCSKCFHQQTRREYVLPQLGKCLANSDNQMTVVYTTRSVYLLALGFLPWRLGFASLFPFWLENSWYRCSSAPRPLQNRKRRRRINEDQCNYHFSTLNLGLIKPNMSWIPPCSKGFGILNNLNLSLRVEEDREEQGLRKCGVGWLCHSRSADTCIY